MWQWFRALTHGRAQMVEGEADKLLETTSANIKKLRALLVVHHEQVELAILDLKRLEDQTLHTRNLLEPGRVVEMPAPVQLSAERRQR